MSGFTGVTRLVRSKFSQKLACSTDVSLHELKSTKQKEILSQTIYQTINLFLVVVRITIPSHSWLRVTTEHISAAGALTITKTADVSAMAKLATFFYRAAAIKNVSGPIGALALIEPATRLLSPIWFTTTASTCSDIVWSFDPILQAHRPTLL